MKRFVVISSKTLGLLLGVAAAAWGATIHVPGDYPTIQEAVTAAEWGDEVLVAPGGGYAAPIHEAGAGDTTRCCVIMKSGVALRGSGMGQTFIDADSSGRGIHVYQCTDVEISDLTITGGYAEVYGGAILCRQSSPHIRRCEITANWDGGIAVVDDSHPAIGYCNMHHNVSKAGGGIEVEVGCAPFIYFCDIVDNEAPFAAGIMLRGDAVIEYCRILRNRTTGETNVLGGGILADDAAPTLNGCEIRDNECFGEGGGLALVGETATARVDRCLISGNVSIGLESRGGGIYVGGHASPTIRNSIIAYNRTTGLWSDGGGVYIQYSGCELANCTLYGNSTAGQFGEAGNLGVETSLFIPLPVAITHTILAASSDGRGIWCGGSGSLPSVSCCDVFGNAGGDEICGTGTHNFSLDPLLCDPAGGNFHIAPSSPCAPGNHPDGGAACDGLLIGAAAVGCAMDAPGTPGALEGEGIRLLGNRPNPFARQTTISFALGAREDVSLEVLDAGGRRVALLHEGPLGPGLQEIPWDGRDVSGERAASGVYFYRLRCGPVTQGLRMLRLQ